MDTSRQRKISRAKDLETAIETRTYNARNGHDCCVCNTGCRKNLVKCRIEGCTRVIHTSHELPVCPSHNCQECRLLGNKTESDVQFNCCPRGLCTAHANGKKSTDICDKCKDTQSLIYTGTDLDEVIDKRSVLEAKLTLRFGYHNFCCKECKKNDACPHPYKHQINKKVIGTEISDPNYRCKTCIKNEITDCQHRYTTSIEKSREAKEIPTFCCICSDRSFGKPMVDCIKCGKLMHKSHGVRVCPIHYCHACRKSENRLVPAKYYPHCCERGWCEFHKPVIDPIKGNLDRCPHCIKKYPSLFVFAGKCAPGKKRKRDATGDSDADEEWLFDTVDDRDDDDWVNMYGRKRVKLV